MTLPATLAALLEPAAYPHAVGRVECVETHVSWVLLTGEIAYKIKRPVNFEFLDLRSLERREFFCREELRLNRRCAPQLYLDVVPITLVGGAACIGGNGEPLEYAVKMRQFPREDELDRLLERRGVDTAELYHFGRELAKLHSGLPVAGSSTQWGNAQTIAAGVLQNLAECARASVPLGCSDEVAAVRPALEQHLDAARPWMTRRLFHERVRECHGDLHAGNIVRLGPDLVAFDCMEFEPAFRWIDVAEEVAFLLGDLRARGHARHALAFLGGYLSASGDYEICRVLALYEAHRTLVRAKINALTRNRSGFHAYLETARRALTPNRPALILVSGLSGSGKTWLAERLAPELDAVHVRSDVERKRLAGLATHEKSGSAVAQALYSRESTQRVYERLAEITRDILGGGYAALVDATFARRAHRMMFAELAQRLHVPVRLIQCTAAPDVLVKRIAAREALATDASEANLGVLDWQQQHWEPPGADEGWQVINVETARTDLAQLVRELRAARL